jgi:hypothetical protein
MLRIALLHIVSLSGFKLGSMIFRMLVILMLLHSLLRLNSLCFFPLNIFHQNSDPHEGFVRPERGSRLIIFGLKHLPEPANAIIKTANVLLKLSVELLNGLDHFSKALIHLVHLLGDFVFVNGIGSIVGCEFVFLLDFMWIGNKTHVRVCYEKLIT